MLCSNDKTGYVIQNQHETQFRHPKHSECRDLAPSDNLHTPFAHGSQSWLVELPSGNHQERVNFHEVNIINKHLEPVAPNQAVPVQHGMRRDTLQCTHSRNAFLQFVHVIEHHRARLFILSEMLWQGLLGKQQAITTRVVLGLCKLNC